MSPPSSTGPGPPLPPLHHHQLRPWTNSSANKHLNIFLHLAGLKSGVNIRPFLLQLRRIERDASDPIQFAISNFGAAHATVSPPHARIDALKIRTWALQLHASVTAAPSPAPPQGPPAQPPRRPAAAAPPPRPCAPRPAATRPMRIAPPRAHSLLRVRPAAVLIAAQESGFLP